VAARSEAAARLRLVIINRVEDMQSSAVTGQRSERWRPPSRRRVYAIRDRLRQLYGVPVSRPHGDGVAELVLTVLSQSTNDRNRDIAYLALRERLPSWEAVRDAPVAEIEQAIRGGGISKVKSARIKAILQAISASAAPAAAAWRVPVAVRPAPGQLELGWLRSLPVPRAQEYLCSLPGVGRKTAACVLLFAYGMRDVPVDTHVSRVGWRLGLFRPGAGFVELHDTMLALTPRGQEWELHLNLLRHGRRTCHAQRPACGECALVRMCPCAVLSARGSERRKRA
jgi:endonuclease-3